MLSRDITALDLHPTNVERMDAEHAELWRAICEECGLYCDTMNGITYICATPYISRDRRKRAPCYVFALTNGALYLERNRRWINEDINAGIYAVVEFPLSDPDFFERVRAHVNIGWHP